MEEDLEQKLSESNVAQIEETKIKVKKRIRTIEGRKKSIENEQETINKGVFSYKEQSARQEISQNKRGSMYLGLEYPDPYTHNSTQREDDVDVSFDIRDDDIIITSDSMDEEMEEEEVWNKEVENRMTILRERKPTYNPYIIARKFFERWSGFIFFLLLLPLTVFVGMLLIGNNIVLMRWRGKKHLNGLQPTSNMEAIPRCPFSMPIASSMKFVDIPPSYFTCGSLSDLTNTFTTSRLELEELEEVEELEEPGRPISIPIASSMKFVDIPHRQFPRGSASNGTDELTTDIAELEEYLINSSSSTSTSHFDNLFVANEEQLKPDLKVALTVTLKGAHMHIPDTGVELDIPTGAIKRKRLIEMSIIPFDKQYASTADFSSNSSVVVELLPNKAIFSLPVHLQLPHCLQLKRNYKEIKNPVKVFVSHHKTGPPVWKEDSIASAKCTLKEDHCVIRLKHFCWVKYEINDKVVVAKRLKVFTAGKSIHANDSIAEIEVGYYMDLPGRAEDMTASLGMEFYQTKPFIFVIDGELPLQLLLSKIVPKEWTYITPEENPKNIPYKSVVGDKDTSCPFALETLSSSERKPLCIFKIVQGNESVELSMRF